VFVSLYFVQIVNYIFAFHLATTVSSFLKNHGNLLFFLSPSYCGTGFNDKIESSSADLPLGCWQYHRLCH